jgi:hypothetical protein
MNIGSIIVRNTTFMIRCGYPFQRAQTTVIETLRAPSAILLMETDDLILGRKPASFIIESYIMWGGGLIQ